MCANGKSDPYYLRFTTPRQKSMIFGSSRAAQGIVPEIINKNILNENIFNYAFTLSNSPYGETYFNAIKAKLDTSLKKSIFILEVSPMALSYNYKKNPEQNPKLFREKDKFLDRLIFFNANPNMDYIIRCYNGNYANIFINNVIDIPMELKTDGWLEVNVPMDKKSIKERTIAKIRETKMKISPLKYSQVREKCLVETIDYLNSFGHVFLVRLPAGKEICQMEIKQYSQFDERMNGIVTKLGISYINIFEQSGEFITTDGNHLWKNDAKTVTKIITDSINEYMERKKH